MRINKNRILYDKLGRVIIIESKPGWDKTPANTTCHRCQVKISKVLWVLPKRIPSSLDAPEDTNDSANVEQRP